MTDAPPASRPTRSWLARPWGVASLAAFLFAGLLLVYRPALHGPFLSDDFLYLTGNPYVQQPTPAHLLAMLDPSSEATTSVQNYAPLVALAHGAAWRAFGAETLGHHVVTILAHAVASSLLASLFVAAGVPTLAALLAALVFAFHPANAEAVAWISQLKSTLCLALLAGALLALPGRPWLATALYGLALAAKATAVLALPVAAAWAWLRPPDDGRARRRQVAFAVLWLAITVAWSALQLPANQHTNASAPPIHPDPLVFARSVVAIVGRYAVMATTSHGLSTFHEPPPALAWLDPHFLLGAAVLAAIAVRALARARARDEELAWWIWAAAAFVPVSQIVPFLYPMADRYLYFILPGLLGAGAVGWTRARRRGGALARIGGPALLALGLAVVAAFAARSHERAQVWRDAGSFTADAIRHYPDGSTARYQRAQIAVQRGDPEAAVRELRRIRPAVLETNAMLADPILRQLLGHPPFRELLREVAGRWIDWARQHERPTQYELHQMGISHMIRGETELARRSFERALAVGGPRDDVVRRDLETLRAAQASADAAREPAGEPRP